MHVKRINGLYYAYESERRGGKVTSRCLGSVPAELVADFRYLDREIRRRREQVAREKAEAHRRAAEEERARRQAERAELGRLKELDRALADYGREVEAAVAGVLAALGYHRPKRGAWRRRRHMIGDGEGADARRFRELAMLARRGDVPARDELRESLLELVNEGGGNLDAVAEENLFRHLPSVGLSMDEHREAIEARMELMRLDLAPPGSGPVVNLLADRAVLDWLHVAVWEQRLAMVWGGKADEATRREYARAFDRATARYQRSLLAVARACRLSLPVLIGQVNVALEGGQQVNQLAPPGG